MHSRLWFKLAPLFLAFSAGPLWAEQPAAGASGAVTFNRDIAPIVFQNCTTCHRPGEVGPFPLTTYGEVRKKAKTILNVVDDGFMPPWHAASHGEFLNERKLTAEQKAKFRTWMDAGMPEGVAADLPPAPQFTSGWQLGEPDLVLDAGEDYTLGAEGRDVYRCFVLPTTNTTDRWVSAVEVRAGNRAVVHHALIYLDTTGRARELDARDEGIGYTSFGGVGFMPSGGLGGWAPGMTASALPKGVAYQLPAGADVVLQVHYHRSGKIETDRTKIGLFYSREPVDKRYRSLPISYRRLRIPAGEANYLVEQKAPVPQAITILAITPHMHLLGQEMKVEALLATGDKQTLVDVPKWDFNWQTTYWFKQPPSLPRGSGLRLTARFDNSATNPNNPSSPPREVTYGEETTNEMCLAFLGFTLDSEHLLKEKPTASVTTNP